MSVRYAVASQPATRSMAGCARAIARCDSPILPRPTMPARIIEAASLRHVALRGCARLPCRSAVAPEAVQHDQPEELGVAQVAAPVAAPRGRDPVNPLAGVSGHPARGPDHALR